MPFPEIWEALLKFFVSVPNTATDGTALLFVWLPDEKFLPKAMSLSKTLKLPDKIENFQDEARGEAVHALLSPSRPAPLYARFLQKQYKNKRLEH